MDKSFKQLIREAREDKFPGKSIRSISELKPFFGENFFAYISKIESGLLPSLEALTKLEDAYSIPSEKFKTILNAFFNQRIKDELESVRNNDYTHSPISISFRKVKKN